MSVVVKGDKLIYTKDGNDITHLKDTLFYLSFGCLYVKEDILYFNDKIIAVIPDDVKYIWGYKDIAICFYKNYAIVIWNNIITTHEITLLPEQYSPTHNQYIHCWEKAHYNELCIKLLTPRYCMYLIRNGGSKSIVNEPNLKGKKIYKQDKHSIIQVNRVNKSYYCLDYAKSYTQISMNELDAQLVGGIIDQHHIIYDNKIICIANYKIVQYEDDEYPYSYNKVEVKSSAKI